PPGGEGTASAGADSSVARSRYLYDRGVSTEGAGGVKRNGPDLSVRAVPGFLRGLEQLLDDRAAGRDRAVLGHVLDLAAFGLVLLVAVDAARRVDRREQVVD